MASKRGANWYYENMQQWKEQMRMESDREEKERQEREARLTENVNLIVFVVGVVAVTLLSVFFIALTREETPVGTQLSKPSYSVQLITGPHTRVWKSYSKPDVFRSSVDFTDAETGEKIRINGSFVITEIKEDRK